MDDVWGEVEEDTYESEHRDREWKRMNSMHAVVSYYITFVFLFIQIIKHNVFHVIPFVKINK